MPKRKLTQRETRQRKEELKEEHGDKCNIKLRCKGISGREYRITSGEDLLLDHKDNNPYNNNPKNHQLSCRACNAAKNPRGKTRFDRHKSLKTKRETIMRERVREGERSLESLDMVARGLTYEQKKNIKGRKLFDAWLFKKVSTNSFWSLSDVVSAGAEIADVEVQTTERWMRRALSSEGKYDTDTVDGVPVVKFKGATIRKENTGPSET